MAPRISLVVVGLSLLSIAACGGGDDSSGATTGANDGGGVNGDGGAGNGDGGGGGGTKDGGPILPGSDGGTGSCTIFPADNPWNTNIHDTTAFPVDANSAAIIDYINTHGSNPGTKIHPDFGSDPSYGIPYIFVPGTQAKVAVTFDQAAESDPGPYPIPLAAPIESGSDAHVIAVDTDNCKLYELDQGAVSGGAWTAYSGALFDLKSNALRPDTWTSADAAGLPIFAGLARLSEVQAGAIDHALRFTVGVTKKKFVHPATHAAGSTDDANAPPMGMRMRLKSTFDTSSYTGAAKVIVVALQQYGMYVADNGSNWYISGETNTSWNDDELNPLKNLAVDSTNFEVIQIGTLINQ